MAAVVAIGGAPVSADAWLVEPGDQALWVRVKAAGQRFRLRYRLTGYCPLEFPVAPGGTYTVAPVITSEESAAAIRVGLGVIVYDHHGDAVAGHTDCTGERPSADESTSF